MDTTFEQQKRSLRKVIVIVTLISGVLAGIAGTLIAWSLGLAPVTWKAALAGGVIALLSAGIMACVCGVAFQIWFKPEGEKREF